MYDYNTVREPLILKEYGRNIQKLMEQITSIEEINIRTQKAHALVKLMEIVNPHTESLQKRWGDLFMLSDYKLEIEESVPRPVKHNNNLCLPMPPTEAIKYKYYGRHIESLLKKVTTLTSSQEKAQMLIIIGKLMRRFSSVWNNECISNEKIIDDIKRMLPQGIMLELEIIRTLPEDNTNGQRVRNKYHIKNNTGHLKK